jgi:hypothetical protein
MSWRGGLIVSLLLLQSADVTLTWVLLSSRPEVVEANPLALAVMQRHGWTGAVLLKLASTAVALGCVLIISRTRPVSGNVLLTGLSTLMLGVVGYSAVLLSRPEDPGHGRQELSRRTAARLDQQWEAVRELVRLRNALCLDLMSGSVELPEAVRQMAAALRQHSDRLSPMTRTVWPSANSAERVALYLVVQCHSGAAGTPQSPEALSEVRAQLAEHYPEANQLVKRTSGPLTWHAVSAGVATE